MASGGCLCGKVRYEVAGELRPIIYCHCTQCKKTSGNYVAATACTPDQLTITVDEGLHWYSSSDIADRGFCRECGGNLFWRPAHERYVGIFAGTLDSTKGFEAIGHIFAADAPDYLHIADDLPQFPDDGPEMWGDDL